MRIFGGNIKGSFYPKTEKLVQPTKHKYGANVTWSAHTDTYKPTLIGHGIDAEINAFKENLQLTILISPSTDSTYEQQIKDVLKTGRFSSGVYFRAFLTEIQEQVDFHKKVTGKHAGYWSYGNGTRDHDSFVLENTLLTRMSAGGNVGYDFTDRLSHTCATIFNYNVRDYGMLDALNDTQTMVTKAIAESGWYNDFSHWHWAENYGDKDQLEQFFTQQRNALNTTNSVTLGAGEAVEYMWLRKQFKRGGLYQDGADLVIISDVRNDAGLPLKVIDATLSIEVDLTGTILEGKEIKGIGDKGILKLGVNRFIVEIPYSKRDGFHTVRLKETTAPNYLDFSIPSVQTVIKSGDTLSVITDKPTNIVVFSVPTGGQLYQASILKRNNIMQTNHEIDLTGIDTTNQDIYVGAITKEKQSVLSVKYNL